MSTRDAVRWAPRPWWEWEDHAAGLYGMPRGYAEQADARAVLASPALLLAAMRDAVKAWPQAAERVIAEWEATYCGKRVASDVR